MNTQELTGGAVAATTSSAGPRPEQPKRIILVDYLEPVLPELGAMRRAAFDYYEVRRGAVAVALSRRTRYDLVIAVYPMSDMGIDEFLSKLREGRSPSSQPDVVLVAASVHHPQLAPYAGEKLTVLALEQPTETLETALMETIREPRRAALRLFAQLEVTLMDTTLQRVVQTRNISRTGAMIAMGALVPIGTRVYLDITLDPDRTPIRVEAEAVRHASEEHEKVSGVGFRFTRFFGDASDRLEEYLARPSVWL